MWEQGAGQGGLQDSVNSPLRNFPSSGDRHGTGFPYSGSHPSKTHPVQYGIYIYTYIHVGDLCEGRSQPCLIWTCGGPLLWDWQ